MLPPSTALSFLSSTSLPRPSIPPPSPHRRHRHRRRPNLPQAMRLYSPGPLRVLNGRGAAPAAGASSTPDISAELKKRIQFLYAAHVTPSGVDYPAMKRSPEFEAYVAQTRLLPRLDVSAAFPDDAHKVAFFVNLYNALTQHAVVAVGAPPAASFMRLLFAMMVGYSVGPYRLSLNDIENGVLRGNKPVSVLPRPFGRSDPRKVLCVSEIEPRVHFVLNCAANSCPPVLFLTADNLESSLSMATQGFFKDSSNLEVDGNRICLSQILNWYKQDFSKDGSDRGVLEFVAANGDPTQQEVKEVQRILREFPEDIAVAWKSYDWGLNSV